MKKKLRYLLRFLSILAVLSPFSLFSQTAIILDNITDLQEIGKQTYYLEDASLELSIDEIRNENLDSEFRPYTQETLNFSSTASAYWVKFKITKTKPGDFYLNVGSAYIDSISLYEFDEENKQISSRHTGDDLPFNTREIEVGIIYSHSILTLVLHEIFT